MELSSFTQQILLLHEFLGQMDAVNSKLRGTKAGAWYKLMNVPPNETAVIRSRLYQEDEKPQFMFGPHFEELFCQRIKEAEEFYSTIFANQLHNDEKLIARQACAGLLWSKQFYHYIVRDWLGGDRLVCP